MRLRLTLEYEGTGFRGWAAQPDQRTVEGSLRAALDSVFPTWSGLAVAGRTDAGVHALGNTASVDVQGGPPAARAAGALNTALPDDVAVVGAEEAPPGFHARHSARARSYRYRIWRRRTRAPLEARRSWWLPRTLDEERLQESAALLLGRHDFRAFTPTETQHHSLVRTITTATWHREGDALVLDVTANGFLRHMVRTLVGTMIDLTPEEIAPLLEGRHRSEAGRTAPPWGLYFVAVSYE